MKLLFIPNWNGHLYLQEYDDKSISKLYNILEYKNKELVNIEKNNILNTNNIIEKTFEKNSNDFIFSITGDHSNSYPLIKSFSNTNTNFKLVIFDAHPDVEVSTDSVSHEDYLRNLIDKKIIKPENIYLIGIRTFSREEFNYLIDKKINFYSITDVLRNKENIKSILKKIKEDIYLSIDIDVLDPDDAPATYYREWCGLHLNELIELIKIIKPKIKSCDLTEFYAEKDEDQITEKNILKIIDFIIQ